MRLVLKRKQIPDHLLRFFKNIGHKPKDLINTPYYFAEAMREDGWYIRSPIVWNKKSCMPESTKDRPTSAWEPIWMFAKSAKYFYDDIAVRQPYARLWDGEARNGTTLAPGSVHTLNTGQPTGHVRQSKPIAPSGGANLRNVWRIPLSDCWELGPEPSRLSHYASFVSEIPRRCILAGSRPGDTVLDPFLGSGTTLLVANQLGRAGLGIELNESYAEMARKRIAESAPLLTAEAVTVEAPRQLGLLDEAAS